MVSLSYVSVMNIVSHLRRRKGMREERKKGLQSGKIEFGSGAFDSTTNGLLVLGILSGSNTCQSVCAKHGLGCMKVYSETGLLRESAPCSSVTVSPRYCWCGQA